MTTLLINTATQTAIEITHERNIRFASITLRTGFRADRAYDSLEGFPGVEIVGRYTEDSPELHGLWFDSWKGGN